MTYKPKLSQIIKWRLYDTKWWFLHRFSPWHRYHIFKVKLKPGWHDRDEILKRAIIKILFDFIEKEKPDDIIDIVASPNRKEREEIQELYDYFKNMPDDYDDDFENYDEITEKLIRVVQLRGVLWT